LIAYVDIKKKKYASENKNFGDVMVDKFGRKMGSYYHIYFLIYLEEIKIYQMLKTMGHLAWDGAFYFDKWQLSLEILYIITKIIIGNKALDRVNLVEIS
jgi:hypothetical protein